VSPIVDRRTKLEVIPRDECVRLLQSRHLGRLAVVIDARPLVFPVNYAMDGDRVVFRTAEGTKLHAASHEEVAFEIDDADARYHTGWSVLVVGFGEDVGDAPTRERYEALPVRPWGEGNKPHWIRIRPRAITGRRIPPHGLHNEEELR
jgi:nitroimidazol reductase NimA-like FMN-containing flavoprotein (pyridoxamine 5'-phosphate oxidase superfamily)